jgi:hypothetical protein
LRCGSRLGWRPDRNPSGIHGLFTAWVCGWTFTRGSGSSAAQATTSQEGLSKPRQAASPRPQPGQSQGRRALRSDDHAYDLLSDKDKRARYDRARSTRRQSKMPVRSGLRRQRRSTTRAQRRFRTASPVASKRAARPPICRPVRRLFGATQAASAWRCRAGRVRELPAAQPYAAEGRRHALRLRSVRRCAATLEPQRVTLRDGKTIDLKLPKGVEEAPDRLPGKGEPGTGGAGDGDRLDRDRTASLLHAATATTSADLAGEPQGGGAWAPR